MPHGASVAPAEAGVEKPAAAESAALPLPLAPGSVGAQLLTDISDSLAHLSADLASNAQAFADFPLLADWVVRLVNDADRQRQLFGAGWRLLLVLGVGLGLEFLARRLLRRPTRGLENAAPAAALPKAGDSGRTAHLPSAMLILRRLPYAFGRFVLDLLPALVLLAIGYLMAGTTLSNNHTTRLVIIGTVQAYVACRVVIAVARLLVSPRRPQLRLVPLSDHAALYALKWTRLIAVLAVLGYTTAEIGLLFGLYRVAYDAFLKIVALAVILCLITVVLQARGAVAAWIHAGPGKTGAVAALRNRAAAIWHVAAIFYLAALWLVWVLEVPDGFTRLLRVVVATIGLAILARGLTLAAYAALDRLLQLPPDATTRHLSLEARARNYYPIARAVVALLITGVALVALFEAWGFDTLTWLSPGAVGGRVLGALGSIATTLVIALVLWELVNAAIQRHLARLAREAQAARSARLRTLLPMLRTTLLISICTVEGLIVLSQIGVNIAPLLAGAGVVGLAIGFGSQKLVQDIITGLFLLLENTMQVGDVVSLGGLQGTVEALSIRTIRLRALDGSVHIVPFSAVTTVTNMTRDFGYAVVDVSVGLNEDPARIADIVRDVAREMRAEPRWDSAIRDDLDVMGVDKFLDTSLVLRTRIKTVPGQRWAVGRELNQRIKMRFDELAIESPWTSFRVLSNAAVPTPVAAEAEANTG
jgi:small conductance mechanosensitive channel